MKTGKTENKNEEVMLGTSPEASKLIEQITKEELTKDLGKAALETLSVILYKGPVKRSDIDYIRGVNSTFILRNLLIRGLVEKKQAPDDARASVYSASFELLAHLGVAEIKNLPNFELVQEELKNFQLIKETGEGQKDTLTEQQ
jgi:segregation and condensation protein B